jgi:hypothetical protein
MDQKVMLKLVDQARKDPKFLHALVFDPESVLKQLDYLDRETRATLVKNSPETVIAGIFGVRPVVETSKEYAP